MARSEWAGLRLPRVADGLLPGHSVNRLVAWSIGRLVARLFN